MSKVSSKVKLRLTAIALGSALSVASLAVHAQQTAGSISGRADRGDVVLVEAKAIGVVRQLTAGSDGGYQASQLPPGEYTVTVKHPDGTTNTQNVTVTAGLGVVVENFQRQQVVVTGARIKTLDVKSTESTTIISKVELDRIPVLRDTTAITLLAPGAVTGDGRIGQTTARGGNVPSLGGASPAENSYYINGFNVTNIVNGVAFSSVPYEGVASQEIKTGGYGAEFGRSLGGVVSVTSKRGTDELHGGANISFEPAALRGSSVFAEKSVNTGDWQLVKRPGDSSTTTYNLWVGGPLIKDTLYGFALLSGSRQKITTFGNAQQSDLTNSSPQYLVKLDWNVNKDNLLELTAFSDKSTDKIGNWKQVTPYQTLKGMDLGNDEYKTGGQNTILKWTGVITDDFTLSALVGRGEYTRSSNVESAGCPYVQDRKVSPRVQYGCATAIPITDPNAGDTRDAYRVDAEWVLGKHTVKFGLDSETYKTVDGSIYPGPNSTDYLLKSVSDGGELANHYVNNTGSTLNYVEARTFSNGGKFETKNAAWYVEDTFQATSNLLLSLGLRSESFTNKNADGIPFIKVNNTYAPRLGASWDVKGNAELKVYGNAGRYYIPVYANTNVRLAGKQLDYSDYFVDTGTKSADKYQVPVLGAQLGGRKTNSDGTAPDPRTIVDPNIKPLFQDEFIAGFQQALGSGWSYGVKYTFRTLKSAMDDICAGANAEAWALNSGYSADQAAAIGATVDHCFLANPGKPLTANVDLNGDGNLTAVTIPADGLGFTEKPKRTYNALEFTLARAWDKKWSFEGTYVLAYSKGNTEGYVKSDIGQDDAGISQDWDYPGLMEGANGYLPNDRRHTFKLFGAVAATDELRVGASYILQSGRPKNCLGFYGGTLDTQSINYGSTSFYCNGVLTPRGTAGRLPWTRELNLQFAYAPNWFKGSTFSVDILNVFNARGVRAVQEEAESAAKTLSKPASPDINYGSPNLASLQKARRVRLLAQYEF